MDVFMTRTVPWNRPVENNTVKSKEETTFQGESVSTLTQVVGSCSYRITRVPWGKPSVFILGIEYGASKMFGLILF